MTFIYGHITDISCLTKENLEYCLCRFICEVWKSTNGSEYPGYTLYQLACALQNYLKKKGLLWKIVHICDFQDFNWVLDRVIQERSKSAIGTVRHQAEVISLEFENTLWEKSILGEDHPDKLSNTVLHLLGVNCVLCAGDEHYGLRRSGGETTSQLSFEENSMNVKCLVYRKDSVTKTDLGGVRDMKKERKIMWIKPSRNLCCCPVRLVGKYLSLLPKTGSKPNLYLHSLRKTEPNCWYSTNPLGKNKVKNCVSQMLKDAGLDGFFTNHSLRRTAATPLFRAGANVKLIKEVTGHVSDVVEKYQITSDQQRMQLSSIIQGKCSKEEVVKSDKVEGTSQYQSRKG